MMQEKERQTPYERLRDAGVLSGDHVEDHHVDRINELSHTDVDAIIRVHKTVGPIDVEGHPTGRAWLV